MTEGIDAFTVGLDTDLALAPTLELAAQTFCDRFYSTFHEFTVLVRVFGTFAYGALPAAEQSYAGTFLARSGAAPKVDAQTPILTLLGSRGIETPWCSRLTSRDHRAIPLLSDEFIDDIPMIARLLGEIGFPRFATRAAWQFVSRDIVDVNGLFFVGDARTATDERGRRVIPSSDFVDRYGVKTVFGFGGPYTGSQTFLTAIVFTRTALTRTQAARFTPIIGEFKVATSDHVDRNRIFNASST